MKIATEIEPNEIEFEGKAQDIVDDVADRGFLSSFDALLENAFRGKTPTVKEVSTWVVKHKKMIMDECCFDDNDEVEKAKPSKKTNNPRWYWYTVWFTVNGHDHCETTQAKSKKELLKWYSEAHPNFNIVKVKVDRS